MVLIEQVGENLTIEKDYLLRLFHESLTKSDFNHLLPNL